MALITSPVFVFLVMTSWIWLTIGGFLTLRNDRVSKVLFAYALLFLVINISVWLSINASEAWLVAFASPILVWLPASVIGLLFYFFVVDSDMDTISFLLIFAAVTFVSFILLIVLWYFILGLISTYHTIVVIP